MVKRLRIKEFIIKNQTDIILLILLLCIGIKYMHNVELFLDIHLKDETLYLNNGVHLLRLGLPNSQWAPFYSIWYYFLSLIQADTINIYFLNLKVLTIALPIILCILLRIRGVSRPITYSIGFFSLVSSGNILVNPKVSHFAILVIIGSLISFSVIKKESIRWYIIILGALLASYVRPELFLAFILLSILVLYKIIKTHTLLKDIKVISFFVLSIIIIIMTLGIPLADGGRSLGAFSQHFSLNWVRWNHSKLNPWTDAHEIVNKNFGNINSLYEAIFSKPELFFKHILSNTSILYQEFQNLINYTVFTRDSYRFENTGFSILIFIIILSTIVNFYRSKKSILGTAKSNFYKNRYLFIISLIYIIPVIASALIIYPRQHYLLMLFFLLVIIIIPLTSVPIKKIKRNEILYTILIFVFGIPLFYLTPSCKKIYTFSTNQNNLETIKYLRSLNINSEVNLLEENGGYNAYLGPNYSYIQEGTKTINFNDYLLKYNINMIVYSGILESNRKFKSDSTWNYFLNNYEKFGFMREVIPNSGNELFLKKDLKTKKLDK